jgi:DNA polymerase elongation subunit (family B)
MSTPYQLHQSINESFAVLSVESKTTKTGKTYQVVELVNHQGPIMGKIWPTSLEKCQVAKNTVVTITGHIDEYQGVFNLVIDTAILDQTRTVAELLPQTHRTPTVIFDIETVGKSFDQLDDEEKAYLMTKLEKDSPSPEIAQDKTGLHPLFGEVAFVALLNPYTQQGIVLGQAEQLPQITPAETEFSFQGFTNEADLLREFWQLMDKYKTYVTYNGHGFDWPFLLFRSAVHRVQVPFELKFHSDNFVDLQRKLRPGSSRPYSLEMITKALGLRNPKAEGVAGNQVTNLYRDHEYQSIVDYVSRDVLSTAQLYLVWAEYLAGKIIV